MSKVAVSASVHQVRVNIDGLPHVLIRRDDLVGMQSYIRTMGAAEPIYFIEYVTHHGEIVCDYSDRTLWEDILKGLEAAHLFDQRVGER